MELENAAVLALVGAAVLVPLGLEYADLRRASGLGRRAAGACPRPGALAALEDLLQAREVVFRGLLRLPLEQRLRELHPASGLSGAGEGHARLPVHRLERVLDLERDRPLDDA